MVGIVIVSHSLPLATGVLELVRQMAPDAPVGIAAGVDDAEHPIGTDATRILGAIEGVRGPDGVLLLMDLGSALLSADMALEMLGPGAGGAVALCAAPLVEGAVAAAVCAQGGGSLEDCRREAEGALDAKAAHVAGAQTAAPPAAAGAGVRPAAAPVAARSVRLPNALGLHARPAASVVRAAARFDAAVTVTNASRGRGPASVASLNALALLELRRGDDMLIEATGPQAAEAVEAIARMAAGGFGESGAASVPAPASAPRAPGRFGGTPVSGGIALGPAAVVRPADASLAAGGGCDPLRESARLAAARAAAARRLEQAADRLEPQLGVERADMLRAEALMLADPAVAASAEAALGRGADAAAAWAEAVDAVLASYETLIDPYLRERRWDAADVRALVLEELAGAAEQPSAGGCVLVLPELLLSGLARLAGVAPVAVVAARGGATSHAAIFARALGVPCVIGVGDEILEIADGALLAVNGDAGEARVVPADEVPRWEAEKTRRRAQDSALRARACEPAVTGDGVRVMVTANIASLADAMQAAALGADGVGVFRTEGLFLAPGGPPDEARQAAVYAEVTAIFRGHPVVVRTLDAGGDKPIAGLGLRGEANPFLGLRGARLYAGTPGVFRAQVRAVLSAAAGGARLEILFPMIATDTEARALRAIVEEERHALGVPAVRTGVMIEVPSAVTIADRLARDADFFSIGTNDLAQYLFAADRGNAAVAALADQMHPALLRAIAATTRAGREAGIPTAVCGELASRPVAAPLLLGLGVAELSVAPDALPAVREAVRRLDASLAARVAEEALQAESSADVAALVHAAFPRLAELGA